MKEFRISWYAVIEDGSVLEGRSLITAETQEEAIADLIKQKSQEYRVRPHSIKIRTIFEFPYSTNSNS